MWSRLLAFALLLMSAPALAGVKEKAAALAPSAVVLVVDAKGAELVAQNADKPFVPASVAKIVTAWLAWRLRRRLPLRDPLLPRRQAGALCARRRRSVPDLGGTCAARGRAYRKDRKAPITGIVLDASYYPANLRIPGIEDNDEAYNALNSALAVNFNTVYAVRSGNTVRSAEKQTPITPIAIAKFGRGVLTEKAASASPRTLRSASNMPAN